MAFDNAVELMSGLRPVVRPAPEMVAIRKVYLDAEAKQFKMPGGK